MAELRPALVEAGVIPEALAAVALEGTEAVTRSLGVRLDAFARTLSEPDRAAPEHRAAPGHGSHRPDPLHGTRAHHGRTGSDPFGDRAQARRPWVK